MQNAENPHSTGLIVATGFKCTQGHAMSLRITLAQKHYKSVRL